MTEAVKLKALIKAYEVPRTLREGKETTGAKALAEIWEKTNDPVLEAVLLYRSVSKMLSNDLPNWEPKADGRVHTTWKFDPPQGQLIAVEPNTLNASKHPSEIDKLLKREIPNGQRFRRMIVAPKGFTFVEFDFRSFHVATMGYVAKDADYIRFSQLDPHSIFASHIMPAEWGIPRIDMAWNDEDILQACSLVKAHPQGKQIRQSQAKPAVLGNQLGLGPRKLWFQNKKYIANIAAADALQQELNGIFPKPYRAKDVIRELADKQGYLKNNFHRIQWFYDVYRWKWNERFNRWERVHGKESEKCIAFSVQSPAFGKITEDILACEKLGYNDMFSFINTIHDSLIFMPEDNDLEECIETVKPLLEAPCPFLRNEACPAGLQVSVDVTVGRNWAKYHEENNPEGMMEL